MASRTLLILTALLIPLISSERAVAVDCSSLILNMADCLSFVTSGSTVEKPEGTCCSGLKTVVRTGPNCLCDAFKNSASLGVTLDLKKAASLPSVCKVAAPPSARCGLSVPVSSPAISPVAGVAAPELSTGGSVGTPVPALGPGMLSTSDASVISMSFLSIFLIIFYCF